MSSNAITDDFTTNPWWWEAAPRDTGLGHTAARLRRRGDCRLGLYPDYPPRGPWPGRGRDVVVLEADALGEGASSRNAGFVGRQLLGGFSQIAEKQGLEQAVNLYRGAEDAYDYTIDLMESLQLKCHLVKRGRVLPVWNKAQYDATEAEFEVQQRHLKVEGQMLSSNELAQELQLTDAYGALLISNTAAVHPGMYHSELLAVTQRSGARTCGGARVDLIRHDRGGKTLHTARGNIKAKEVIIATNAYTGGETAWIRRRLVRSSAFMAATEPLQPALLTKLMPTQRTYVEYSRYMINFWRPAPDDNRLLFGGQSGLLHKSNEEVARRLQRDLKRVFPELEGTRFLPFMEGLGGFHHGPATPSRIPQRGLFCGGM